MRQLHSVISKEIHRESKVQNGRIHSRQNAVPRSSLKFQCFFSAEFCSVSIHSDSPSLLSLLSARLTFFRIDRSEFKDSENELFLCGERHSKHSLISLVFPYLPRCYLLCLIYFIEIPFSTFLIDLLYL